VFSGVEDREIYEGVDSDSRLPQAEKRQVGVIAEGGGGGSTVGVMKDYKLKQRNLRASHTLGWSWNWNT
jgi:hypothetical protein